MEKNKWCHRIPDSTSRKRAWSAMENTTEKPSQMRMNNLLLASALVGFKDSFRIVITTGLMESRE